MPRPEIIDLSVIIVHATARAVLVKETEDSEGAWLPLSQVEIDGEPGRVGTVTLPEWLAREKGLI